MINSLTVRKPKDITSEKDVLQIVQDWHTALKLQVDAGDISEMTAASV